VLCERFDPQSEEEQLNSFSDQMYNPNEIN